MSAYRVYSAWSPSFVVWRACRTVAEALSQPEKAHAYHSAARNDDDQCRASARENCSIVLSGAHLEGISLRGLNLHGASLQGARLANADREDACLGDASLQYADLQGANLCGADLQGANLCTAKLANAQLQHANMQAVQLGGADLRGASMRDVYLGIRGIDQTESTSGAAIVMVPLPNRAASQRNAACVCRRTAKRAI